MFSRTSFIKLINNKVNIAFLCDSIKDNHSLNCLLRSVIACFHDDHYNYDLNLDLFYNNYDNACNIGVEVFEDIIADALSEISRQINDKYSFELMNGNLEIKNPRIIDKEFIYDLYIYK